MVQSSNITCSCAGKVTAKLAGVSPTVINKILRGFLRAGNRVPMDEIIVVSGRFVRIFVHNYHNQWQTACGFSLDEAINNLAGD